MTILVVGLAWLVVAHAQAAAWDGCAAARANWTTPSEAISDFCAQGVCQWACAVFNCSEGFTPQASQRFNPAVSGSCAHVVSAAPNETLCVRRAGPLSSSGCPSWSLQADRLPRSASIELGFAQALFASHLLVVEAFTVGFVTRVDILNNATGEWLLAFNGTEQNRTVDARLARVAAFALPNHILTDRVRLSVYATLETDRVNGVALVGQLRQPAPTPLTAPPTPYPTVVETPPTCVPRRVQWDESLDISLGDQWCDENDDGNRACAFPCSLASCSWRGSDIEYCLSLVGDSAFSVYENYDDFNPTAVDWIVLDFGAPINASGLLIGHGVARGNEPVISITRGDTGKFLFENDTSHAAIERSNVSGAISFYPFEQQFARNVQKVNITVWPWVSYALRFVRLVGTVDPPLPRLRVPRRLPGRFRLRQVPLAEQVDEISGDVAGRFDILAPNAPPPLLDSKTWFGPGRYNLRNLYLTSEGNWFDECDFQLANGSTSPRPCSRWNDYLVVDPMRALEDSLHHVQGALVKASGADIPVAVFGTHWVDSVYATVQPQYRAFGRSTPWKEIPVARARARGCLMTLGDIVYHAGGVSFDDERVPLLHIEYWSFSGDSAAELQVEVRELTQTLSRARASSGCTTANDSVLIVAGGYTFNPINNLGFGSDVLDMVSIEAGRVASTRMPRAVVAPSVAAVRTSIIVVAGAPRARLSDGSERVDAFDLALERSYNMARDPGGVMIYDLLAGEWTFSPNTLSPLLWNEADNIPAMRVAVPFYNRFIAVVGGEAVFSHDGSVDPTRIGAKSYTRPIDVFDAEKAVWHRNVAQHHASVSFSVVSSISSSRVVVVGGLLAEGYNFAHAIATVLDWEENTNIVDCAEVSSCSTCVLDETTAERCSFCLAADGGGTCGSVRQSCRGNATATTSVAVCPAPPPETTEAATTTTTTAAPAPTPAAATTTTTTVAIVTFTVAAPQEDKNWVVFAAVLGTLGGLVLLGLVAGLVVFLMRRNRKAAGTHAVALEDVQTKPASGSNDNVTASVPADDSESLSDAPAPRTVSSSAMLTGTIERKYVIDESDLKRGKKLGEGAFGEVYMAKWRNVQVAVKEIRPIAAGDKKQIESFEQEMASMCRLQPHANVIQLYGVVIGKSLAIVTEFAPFGALDDWLLKSEGKTAPVSTLVRIAAECAAGLAHLHAQKVIHRDVAARNVLLGVGMVAKIADFGLSRSVDGAGGDDEDEGKTKSTVGPLRHMAPESMRQRVYSPSTDAFSYGVLLFEIFERGKTPWEGISITEAAAAVLNGKRLKLAKDNDAPDVVRQLMADCFKTEPKKRPTMAAACERLSDFENNSADSSADNDKPVPLTYGAPPSASYRDSQYSEPQISSTGPVSRVGEYTNAPPPSDQEQYTSAPAPDSAYERAPVLKGRYDRAKGLAPKGDEDEEASASVSASNSSSASEI
jgi:serine/threonine protein kinase